MENYFCFVYSHKEKKKIKVLTLLEAKDEVNQGELAKEGWLLSATIDPCKWLEYLHNECEPEDIVSEVKDFSNETSRTK